MSGWFTCLLVAACTFRAQADKIVTVSVDGFSPDPVSIVAGESVYWVHVDGDPNAPYSITSDSGAWATFQTPGGVKFYQAGTNLYHDEYWFYGNVYVSSNTPPSVTITNPLNNAILTAPATFVFGADASDTNYGLAEVELYVGPDMVADIFASPFVATVTNLPAGTYVLTAIAYDNMMFPAFDSITITVTAVSFRLTAPSVAAGQFQFTATGLTIGRTNVLQVTTNLVSLTNWTSIATNVANANSLSFTNPLGGGCGFFRLFQLP
jgi:hypothetical protein